MKTSSFMRAAAVALFALAIAGPTAAFADIGDYEFQLVEPTVKKGERVFAVRLLNRTTGKVVPDAVIFAVRLDMAPDDMEGMDTRIAAVPAGEPDVYSFKANFSMTGRWRLSLGAKVQGETGTVDNKLLITALK
ncbi:FixH family protein [Bradyrhizobium sp.]|uniref:FixH family protein n=1 Tax=Bradyrhizobium sp. TaxID=376 RepID=UPI00403803BE